MEEFWSLRRASDGKVAGVCSALAARWDVDPLVVRIGAVLLALSAGVGAVLYLFAWALLPRGDEEQSMVQRVAPGLARQSREFWLAAVIIVTAAVALSIGTVAPLGLMPAVVVIAVWYFGFRRPQRQAREREQAAPLPAPAAPHDPFAGPETAFTSAAREWQQTVLAYRSGAGGPATVTGRVPAAGRVPPVDDPPPREDVRPWPAAPATSGPVPTTSTVPVAPAGPSATAEATAAAERLSTHTAAVRQYLGVPDPAGLYTAAAPPAGPTVARRRGNRVLLAVMLGGLLVVLGGLAVVDAVTGWPVVLATYVGAALAVTAITCVVAAFTGRFRGLVGMTVLAAVLATVLGVGQSMVRAPQWMDSMDRSYTSLAELPPSDGMDVGTVEVDLSGLDVTEDRRYAVRTDLGTVRLVLPRDEHVEVRAVVDVGSIAMPEESSQGADLRQSGIFGDADEPRLLIEAVADVGRVEVVHR